MTLTLAACEEADGLGVMQTNPQEAIMQADGVKVAYGENLTGNTLDLTKYENNTIKVITCTEAKDLPEGASVEYKMDVATDAEFNTFQTLQVTDGTVKANEWEHICRELVGKSPLPVKQWVRFAVYIKTAGDLVRVGGNDTYMAQKEVTVTPYDLKLPVEASYTLQLTENGTTKDIVMSHSPRHPYDDPVFTAVIDVTSSAQWDIVNASKSKVYGVDEMGDPTQPSGNLELGGGKAEIASAGTYKIEVNMLDLSYSITFAFDYLWTPGPASGWGFGADNMKLTTTDYITYGGYVYVENEFKLCAQADWNPLNWGYDNGVLSRGGTNIKAPGKHLYYVEANFADMSLTLTDITKIGMIGGFNGWGGDAELTPSADFRTWTGTVEVKEAGEWKFRMNGEWKYNLGGSFDKLEQNGANLKFDAAGTYEVTLKLGALPYSCTVVKK